MKRWSLPFGFLLIALGAAFYYQQHQASGRASFPAPDFSLKDLGGHTLRLGDFRGKVVFLNMWATWCPPCRMEMPSMEHLYQRLQGKDFVMLAVSEDEDGTSAVRPFIEQMRLTFPILIDQQGVLPPRYGVTGYPETFIIDRDGQVIQHTIGPEDWGNDRVYEYFTRLLNRETGTTQTAGEHPATGN
jgi:peroxiredoxin